MYARLFSKTGQSNGNKYVITETATIGKLKENAISLNYGIISKEHARIYYSDDEKCYFLEDLESRNGTRLDGKMIERPEKLGALHVITFASKFDFIFQVVDKPVPLNDIPEAIMTIPGYTSLRENKAETRIVAGPDETIVPGSGITFPDELKQTPPEKKTVPEEERTVMDSDFKFPEKLAAEKPVEKKPTSEEEPTVMDSDFKFPEKLAAEKPVEKKPTSEEEPTIMDPDFEFPNQLDPHREKVVTDDSEDLKTQLDANYDFSGHPELDLSGKKAAAPETIYIFDVLEPRQLKGQFEIQEGKNIIGRQDGCDIVIKNRSISRNHAQITLAEGKLLLKDLQSANFTLLDGKKITVEQEVKPGAEIQFGLVRVKLQVK